MKLLLPALLLAVVAIVLWLGRRIRQRSQGRQRAIRELLDAADALEARLRTARDEIEAVAGDHQNPVRGAMQEILRQRLWLQDNAASADLAQLDAVRRSLDSARASRWYPSGPRASTTRWGPGGSAAACSFSARPPVRAAPPSVSSAPITVGRPAVRAASASRTTPYSPL